jgi:hypothetical protein
MRPFWRDRHLGYPTSGRLFRSAAKPKPKTNRE